MELPSALEFARSRKHGVLVTLKRDGHPQLSNVLYNLGSDGTIRVSITADRAKYHNLRRDPWTALHITTDDFWRYVVLEGTSTVGDPATTVDDARVAELVEYYRAAVGEHDDWDEYRASMVRDKRLLVHLRPERAYGALRA